jgi:hypothetical protein
MDRDLNLTQDYLQTLQRRYDALWAEAEEDQAVIILHYSPSGKVLQVDSVTAYRGWQSMVIVGTDTDGTYYEVIIQPQSAQLVLTLVSPPDSTAELERRSVGFRMLDEPGGRDPNDTEG